MISAHRRLEIRRHLPEVEEVRDYGFNDVVSILTVRLRLSDGSSIAVIEQHGRTKTYRSRLAEDYSDRVTVLPIDTDLRGRLVLAFGPMTFRDPQ